MNYCYHVGVNLPIVGTEPRAIPYWYDKGTQTPVSLFHCFVISRREAECSLPEGWTLLPSGTDQQHGYCLPSLPLPFLVPLLCQLILFLLLAHHLRHRSQFERSQPHLNHLVRFYMRTAYRRGRHQYNGRFRAQ